MGADLYFSSSFQKAVKKYGPRLEDFARKRDATTNGRKGYYQGKAVEYFDKIHGAGCYRDSYDDSNLLWKLGLDYAVWFKAFLDDQGCLHPDKAALVLQELEYHRYLLEEVEDNEERKYFEEKFEKFTDFLRTAIRISEPITCSIS